MLKNTLFAAAALAVATVAFAGPAAAGSGCARTYKANYAYSGYEPVCHIKRIKVWDAYGNWHW